MQPCLLPRLLNLPSNKLGVVSESQAATLPLNQLRGPRLPAMWFTSRPWRLPSCWQMAWWAKGSSWTSQRLRGSRPRTTSASPTMEWPHPTSARSRSPSTVSTRQRAPRRHISSRLQTSAVTAGWCIIDTHVNPFSRASLCMNSWFLIPFPLEETAGLTLGLGPDWTAPSCVGLC